ncbi:Cas9 inhibitor AcrIIA9 family protein [Thomasclavelia sp.]|uniref:Cas9 inhibitor AcrIIA9 family protein n=1 Tax=Thomasclavelia sp. TaxID=3025757 RepID=UPI0025CE33B7|nr:Cas9 inhibitor AcrIIA9 family protein [Thomasclavelia sp.]
MKLKKEMVKYKSGSIEKEIGQYLLERSKEDLTLAKNLEKENKSLKECTDYIKGEFYIKATNGVYFGIDNNELFQMAVHYYQEDNIKMNKLPGGVQVRTNVINDVIETEKKKNEHKELDKETETKRKRKSKKSKDVAEGQMSLF